MTQNLEGIAQQLKNADKKVQLIYAFNGTGKTRLSKAFKELIAPKAEDGEEKDEEILSRQKILYYNAFTEDLFYWDNDLEKDGDPKLKIQPNSFTDWILGEQGQEVNIVETFQRYTNDKLTPIFIEKDIEQDGRKTGQKTYPEVIFSFERGTDESSGNIKISKGEESNFVWSIFYTLLDLVVESLNKPEEDDRETDQFNQLEYVFIDDPVSSLDENHLIQLAVNLGRLIKSSQSQLKFIISTHNPLFYNILYNELSLKTGFILSRMDDGTFELEEKRGDSNKSFSYHLHVKDLIQQAVNQDSVQRYHFALLRNLYEKTANFLGYNKWSDLLPGDQKAYASRIMNFYPHNTLSNEEIAEPTAPEKAMVRLLLDNLNNYGYWQQGEQND
ncbi:anticodon nuclease [Kiloniella litopenaei]|uniref:Anticodon nuclease n=1 Tax=Kiloniella litopenaei TaxID=1549748 RepID=A0A0M2RED4_9PROT|nr:AAA family ATPase [Kiloniella litopenaei]KKJ77928.1 anticodon nuclease [Kiloniella litopenaei]